jgi:hypothetical protein
MPPPPGAGPAEGAAQQQQQQQQQQEIRTIPGRAAERKPVAAGRCGQISKTETKPPPGSMAAAVVRDDDDDPCCPQAVRVLGAKKPKARTEEELAQLVVEFAGCDVFASMGFLKQCVGRMHLASVAAGEVIEVGRDGEHFLNVVLRGSVQLVHAPKGQRAALPARTVGPGRGFMAGQPGWTARTTPRSDCLLAVLPRADYIDVSRSNMQQVLKILEKAPKRRSKGELDWLMSAIFCADGDAFEFFASIPSDALRRLMLRNARARVCANGEVVFKEGEQADAMYVVVCGVVQESDTAHVVSEAAADAANTSRQRTLQRLADTDACRKAFKTQLGRKKDKKGKPTKEYHLRVISAPAQNLCNEIPIK